MADSNTCRTRGRHRKVEAKRREAVSLMTAMGLTLRQISEALAKEGIVSPRTGKAYTHPVIIRDQKILEAEWRRRAARSIDEHKARLLHELSVIKLKCYEVKDYRGVMEAIKQERAILGTDAPQEIRVFVEQFEQFRQVVFVSLAKLPPEMQELFIRELERQGTTALPELSLLPAL